MGEEMLILTTITILDLWACSLEMFYHQSHSLLTSISNASSIPYRSPWCLNLRSGSCSTSAWNVSPHIEIVTHFSIRSCGLQTKAYQSGSHLPRAVPRYRLTCAELYRMCRGWCMLYSKPHTYLSRNWYTGSGGCLGKHPAKTLLIE
jgi:hypothetical protein